MKPTLLLSGSTGFIGSYLRPFLEKKFQVTFLSRNPGENSLTYTDLKGKKFDLVIHLSGENVFGLWTKNKKRKIANSRIKTTDAIVQALKGNPPQQFICASAVGFYGNRPKEELTEKSKKGEGFLSDLCHSWEEKAKEMPEAIVSHLRFGMVLGKDGGALPMLTKICKWGLGGKLGQGDQIISWISVEDLIQAILLVIDKKIPGVINIVSPNPVSQKHFIKTLCQKIKRPCFMHTPSFILKALLGDFATEVLLTSQKVIPSVLQKERFSFRYPHLSEYLDDKFGKK
jgi:uncharacterized protein